MKTLLRFLPLGLLIILAGCVTPSATPPKEGYTPPKLVERTRPQYPFELQTRGVSGSATVEIVVNTEGEVTDTHVVEATEPDFGVSAVMCVRHWKFKPATRDGVPVEAKLQVPLYFTLESRKLD